MLVELQLDDGDAQALQQAASRSHMSPEHFVFIAVQQALGRTQLLEPQVDQEERKRRVFALMEDWGKTAESLPVLPDSSFHRDFFYDE